MPRDQGEERGGHHPTARARLLGALARLRLRRSARAVEEREALGQAVLVVAGKVGVEAVSVEQIVAESGLPRLAFYRHFAGAEECFLDAHSRELDRLADQVLAAGCTQTDWQEVIAAALEEAARLFCRRPLFYRGLLIEGRQLDARVLPVRERISSRLAAAIDSVRPRLGSDEEPPPNAASFVVAAYEYSASAALRDHDPGRFATMVPELVDFATRVYPPSGGFQTDD